MADATDKQAMLRQCLIDIGYEEAERSALMSSNTESLLQSLAKRRQRLLTGIHRDQQRMDCLDFLVYQLQREALCGAAGGEANKS